MIDPCQFNFAVTKQEAEIIRDIHRRAMETADRLGHPLHAFTLALDLAACHATTPLRLLDLRDADEVNFVHDIYGISAHMDRDKGRLDGLFTPRYAKPRIIQ
jgi:hypothetical protein